MEEFKGTKQEWVRDGRMVYALEDGENRFYAGFAPGRNCLKGEAEANAQLTIAAPDLLEALQLLMAEQTGGNKSCGHNGFTCTCPYDKARAAIAKALGK